MSLSKIKFRTLGCFLTLRSCPQINLWSLSVSQSAQFTTDTQTMTRGQWRVTEGMGGTGGRWMLWPSDRRFWWSPGSWGWQWSVPLSSSSPWITSCDQRDSMYRIYCAFSFSIHLIFKHILIDKKTPKQFELSTSRYMCN